MKKTSDCPSRERPHIHINQDILTQQINRNLTEHRNQKADRLTINIMYIRNYKEISEAVLRTNQKNHRY